ncbi:PAN2-PAN3 deadenylation complex subunit PAN3 isoform X2 [Vanessa cardui]|uniref:PAN2-PAN3 deadenylation complex subunit PAN3 isoform X2 n=1 Tax=Vanessa cardui TaxID=171605 RepID=UPI001F13A696|nr:PAN2-PAN3 deadenylation complex subunit PAN3 isoform X2 [Vanessa cardui]
MDPSMFLQYSPPTGLPQESKLATYMSRSTSTPTRSLNQAMSNLSMESSPTAIKKTIITHPPPMPQPMPQPPPMMTHLPHPQFSPGTPLQAILAHAPPPQMLIGEFVPINYFSPPPMPLPPESPQSSPPNPMVMPPVNTQVHQENVGGTTYFYSTNPDSMNASGLNAPPLNQSGGMVPEGCIGVPSAYASQMYAGVPAHMPPVPAQNKPGLAATFYTPETIRSEIYQRNEDVFLQPDIQLPETVEMYAELTPLEGGGAHALATSYRATHRASGEHYALRRLHACAAPPALLARAEPWRNVDHPNVVRLHRCFATTDFGDRSVVLVYDYHPACMTLMTKYLATGAPGGVTDGNGAFHDPFSSDPDAPRPYTHQKNAMLRAVACGALLPEAVLWSLLVQLTAGLRAIHTAGLACRSLDATKVVMNGCRIRIAWGGIADVIHNSNVDIAQAQQEDMTALGRLALGMACRTAHCDNLNACMDLVARSYSADLKNLILYLLSATTRRSVTDLMPMIGARFYTQFFRGNPPLLEQLKRRTPSPYPKEITWNKNEAPSNSGGPREARRRFRGAIGPRDRQWAPFAHPYQDGRGQRAPRAEFGRELVGDWGPVHAEAFPGLLVPFGDGRWPPLARPGPSRQRPQQPRWGLARQGGANVARRAERSRSLLLGAEALSRSRFRGGDASGWGSPLAHSHRLLAGLAFLPSPVQSAMLLSMHVLNGVNWAPPDYDEIPFLPPIDELSLLNIS